ncbi:3-oxoacyl-[acyl-carrier protein] reductase [Anaerosolibacter carboniphilus]|uniref:3-oxoacyl-[acyl-carrier protein] reductase n=1 Tax=Anaerosolibacter carboniphilus TaxID=1417629 RepID=A0A841KW11_9FIRM|nr:SDR family oxidoreductase [Anaerosolibacter carboniphilus]MBB6216428.1 3-oxoacyl-[acyl-carrier protein] reductase [Anaerosolibacter carboniphilus]
MHELNDSQKFSITPFESFTLNDKAELTHEITQKDVDTFAELTGDYNPLHLDPSFARRTRFRKPVVYGMLSASFISTMIGMLLPGKGALWVSQTIEFLHQVYVGDTIHITATIKQISKSVRTLVLGVEIKNQHNQLVIVGESKVKLTELEGEEQQMEDDRKIVLITGGTRGIGAEVAYNLSKKGHTVILNYVNSDQEAFNVVKEIESEGGRAYPFKADISNWDEVEDMFKKIEEDIGAVEAVVHCAAPKNEIKAFDQLEWNEVQKHIDIQLKGAFNCVKASIANMIEARFGSFIFIGSIASDGVPPLHQTDYIIAKSALTTFARSMAVEYGPKGIRFNIVAPGMTQTDRIGNMPDKSKILVKMQTPLRRLAEPSDIAGVVSFLLEPGARYITGETIRVCGGSTML